MAILAAAMLPLLALQGQFVQTVASFERADIRIAARQNALAFLKDRNFTLQQAGEVTLNGVNVQWDAVLVEAPRRTRLDVADVARYEASLYTISVNLDYSNGGEETFRVRGLGWRPVWPIAGGL